jgi:8-oxo-dGTP pyrophosphatase MutT (NUDIX family)
MPDKRFFIGVKALITNPKDEILILKKSPKKPTDKWEPYWDLPGGKIQSGGIKETLIREVAEELGIDNLEIMGLYDVAISNFDIHDGSDTLSLFFVVYECKITAGSELKLSEEHSEYRWVRPDEAKRLLTHMLPKHFLEELSDGLKK